MMLRILFFVGVLAMPGLALAEGGGHGGHGSLDLGRILFAKVGEDASEEEIAEAKHETLSFWGSVVNFALLVYVIRRMSKKPLQGFLDARREEVERGMVEAREMKTKAEAVWNEYTERMKTLDQELAKLRSDMEQAAIQDKARIVAEAEEDSRRLRVETEALIARQSEQLEAQIRREVVEAAVSAAERAVREATTAEDQKRLADAFAKQLATVATTVGTKTTEKRA